MPWAKSSSAASPGPRPRNPAASSGGAFQLKRVRKRALRDAVVDAWLSALLNGRSQAKALPATNQAR